MEPSFSPRALRANARSAKREQRQSSPISVSPRRPALLTPPPTIRTYAVSHRSHQRDPVLSSPTTRANLSPDPAGPSSATHSCPVIIHTPTPHDVRESEILRVLEGILEECDDLKSSSKVKNAVNKAKDDLIAREENSLRKVADGLQAATQCPICVLHSRRPFMLPRCGHTFCGPCLRILFSKTLEKKLKALRALSLTNTRLFDTQVVPTSIEHFEVTLEGLKQFNRDHWSTSPVDVAEFKRFISDTWEALADWPGLLPGSGDMVPHDHIPSPSVASEVLLSIKLWTIPVAGGGAASDKDAAVAGHKNCGTIDVSKEGLGDVLPLLSRLLWHVAHMASVTPSSSAPATKPGAKPSRFPFTIEQEAYMDSFIPEFEQQVRTHDPKFDGRRKAVADSKTNTADTILHNKLFEDLPGSEERSEWRKAILRRFTNHFVNKMKRNHVSATAPTATPRKGDEINKLIDTHVLLSAEFFALNYFALEIDDEIIRCYRELSRQENIPGGGARARVTKQMWEEADKEVWIQKAEAAKKDIYKNQREYPLLDGKIKTELTKHGFDVQDDTEIDYTLPGEDGISKSLESRADMVLPRIPKSTPAVFIPANEAGILIFPAIDVMATAPPELQQVPDDYLTALWEFLFRISTSPLPFRFRSKDDIIQRTFELQKGIEAERTAGDDADGAMETDDVEELQLNQNTEGDRHVTPPSAEFDSNSATTKDRIEGSPGARSRTGDAEAENPMPLGSAKNGTNLDAISYARPDFMTAAPVPDSPSSQSPSASLSNNAGPDVETNQPSCGAGIPAPSTGGNKGKSRGRGGKGKPRKTANNATKSNVGVAQVNSTAPISATSTTQVRGAVTTNIPASDRRAAAEDAGSVASAISAPRRSACSAKRKEPDSWKNDEELRRAQPAPKRVKPSWTMEVVLD
ncbi:hypothetical protein FPV67DRAFT_1455113 [Lyophyllum atratum]|nr:hypothetical protein FPV67DRAFT_1455113 [Lyophyllum atratum]